MTNSELIKVGVDALQRSHWNGEGCGTHGTNACVYCFGPSPMGAYEVVETILAAVEPAIRVHERKQFAGDLWSHLQPMVSWIAAQ